MPSLPSGRIISWFTYKTLSWNDLQPLSVFEWIGEIVYFTLQNKIIRALIANTLFRIISIPSKFCYFRLPDPVILMACRALDFQCQCTQQKLQSICAVLTFDPQLKKNLNIFCKRQISIKLFYLYQRLQCRDNYFFTNKFVLFLYLLLSSSWKKHDLPLIYFWYQTDSGAPNISIYSAVSLASPYYNYL